MTELIDEAVCLYNEMGNLFKQCVFDNCLHHKETRSYCENPCSLDTELNVTADS